MLTQQNREDSTSLKVENEGKTALKVTDEFVVVKKLDVFKRPRHSFDLTPVGQRVSYWIKLKAERRMHNREGGNPEFGDIHGLQTDKQADFVVVLL